MTKAPSGAGPESEMMEVEQAASAASEAASTATAADAQAAPQQSELGQLAGDGTAAPSNPEDETAALLALLPVDDGTEEVEWEGEKHKIPAKLKSAFMAHADYTRKTQEVAEQRRQIEANQTAFQQQVQFQKQHLTEVAGIVAIDNQLAEYDKLDWPSLIQQNPQQAMLLDQQRRELQGKKAQIAQTLTQKQQQSLEQQRTASARRIQETQSELAREIKGWSPEYANKLGDYGKSLGFSQDLLNSVANLPFAAPLVKALHKANQYDQLIAQRSAKKPAPAATPVTKVTARASTAVTDPDKLPPEQWKKWREDQIAAKRKAR